MSDAKLQPQSKGPGISAPESALSEPMTPEPAMLEPAMPGPAMPEPSMEEIIASISRVIAADNRSTGPVRAPADRGGVLELTEAIGADGSVRRLAPLGAPTSTSAPSTSAPSTNPGAPPDPAPQPAAKPEPSERSERILSAATSGAAASAFARLGAIPRERRAEADQTIGAGERTLEEIVRDTLRPLLQAWLDNHLPAIVERLVGEEIARVVGEAGLR
jgi:uncharacterized protein